MALLPGRPSIFDCVDIREEVAESLAGAPCRASTGDLVVDQSPAGRYDLAVATNLLVYLRLFLRQVSPVKAGGYVILCALV